MKKLLILIILLFTVQSLAQLFPYQNDSRTRVRIMTFNVENLFDTQNDPNKEDETFLPLSSKQSEEHIRYCKALAQEEWQVQCLEWDWNEKVLHKKLKRIARAITRINYGKGPEIIAFQEVENLFILEKLRTEYLANLGYKKSILIEGDDARGIDVAFMSKFDPVGGPTLHKVPFVDVEEEVIKDTRGILEQSFLMPDGQVITGFNVHFPAPFLPNDMRKQSYDYLNQLLKNKNSSFVFALGDFNTIDSELYGLNFLKDLVKPNWTVPHEPYCKKCKGTYYYPPTKDWSFLDMIILAKGFHSSGWLIEDIYLANQAWQQKTLTGKPKGFKMGRFLTTGVSDHWPMVIELVK